MTEEDVNEEFENIRSYVGWYGIYGFGNVWNQGERMATSMDFTFTNDVLYSGELDLYAFSSYEPQEKLDDVELPEWLKKQYGIT